MLSSSDETTTTTSTFALILSLVSSLVSSHVSAHQQSFGGLPPIPPRAFQEGFDLANNVVAISDE